MNQDELFDAAQAYLRKAVEGGGYIGLGADVYEICRDIDRVKGKIKRGQRREELKRVGRGSTDELA